MDYEIKGNVAPVVEIRLEAGESVKCEAGSMVWMSDNMEMETKGGGAGKMLGRLVSGEKMFQNVYRAKGGPGMITFGSSFVGSIEAHEITPGREMICQKSAFLAGTPGIDLAIAFQKKISGGFFGGEGFIMQKISGQGLVFLEIDGNAISYELQAGERLVIDTGYLVMMDATCSLSVETVKGGLKNIAFGGEGMFNTVVTGPGKVTVQTMPRSALAGSIASVLPSKS